MSVDTVLTLHELLGLLLGFLALAMETTVTGLSKTGPNSLHMLLGPGLQGVSKDTGSEQHDVAEFVGIWIQNGYSVSEC